MINLEISRNDRISNISIKASELSVPNMSYHLIEDTKIGYILNESGVLMEDFDIIDSNSKFSKVSS